MAHKVPACYTVRRTPQGIKKSGYQIQRIQRISALYDTENRFLSTLGVSIAWHHFNAIISCLFPFCCHNRRIWHHPNISRSSRTLCSFLASSSSVSVGATACTCGGCSETKVTSCNSSRIMRRTSSAVREVVPILSSALPTAVTTNLLIEPYCFLSRACSL